VAVSFVVALAGLVVLSAAPVGPVQDELDGVVGGQGEAVDQAPEFGDAEQDESG